MQDSKDKPKTETHVQEPVKEQSKALDSKENDDDKDPHSIHKDAC